MYATFKHRARHIYTSNVDYDDARSFEFAWDTMPSEDDVRAIVDAYECDVANDHALAQALRRRCGLGRRAASGWLLERTPQWVDEYASKSRGNVSDTSE